jgi:cytochrome c
MKIWAGAVAVIVGFATQASAQSGDPAKGQRVFNQQCRACHTLEKGGASTVGPNLHAVFGRKAGTAEGFTFSEAMVKSGIVWDDKTLAEYNRDPKGKVPGTKMVFNGVKQQGQLDDLMAYLKQATQ